MKIKSGIFYLHAIIMGRIESSIKRSKHFQTTDTYSDGNKIKKKCLITSSVHGYNIYINDSKPVKT